jgi:hypothetical protein
VVVVLPLVVHGRDGHGPPVDDLEQRHVAGVSERDDQLAQEGARADLAAREGKLLEERPSRTASMARASASSS